jgi:hypothetical protein
MFPSADVITAVDQQSSSHARASESHARVRGARPRQHRAARLRPRLPRVRRVRRPHARPLLRPVHLRPLPPGLRAARGKDAKVPAERAAGDALQGRRHASGR